MLRFRSFAVGVLLLTTTLSACSSSPKVVPASQPYEQFFSQVMSRISRNKINATRSSRIYATLALGMLMVDAPRSPESQVLLSHVSDVEAVKSPSVFNVTVAAIAATSSIARSIFPTDIDRSSVAEVRDLVLSQRISDLDTQVVRDSLSFGQAVAASVLRRSKTDGFDNATIDSLGQTIAASGRWVPTPPSYQPASDPGWGTLRPFLVARGDCSLPTPLVGDDASSPYENDAQEVRAVAEKLTTAQKAIARFWDDGRGRTGTPTGHWLNIALVLNHAANMPESTVIRSLASVALGNADSMINAWREKYTYRVERPVTVLQRHDPTWNSYLVTPAFPEYPSGHSTLSRNSAVVLKHFFGNMSFDDPGYGMTIQSREQFKISQRHFSSVIQAADEASISRLYAGIHYTQSLNAGKKLGDCVGREVVAALSAS